MSNALDEIPTITLPLRANGNIIQKACVDALGSRCSGASWTYKGGKGTVTRGTEILAYLRVEEPEPLSGSFPDPKAKSAPIEAITPLDVLALLAELPAVRISAHAFAAIENPMPVAAWGTESIQKHVTGLLSAPTHPALLAIAVDAFAVEFERAVDRTQIMRALHMTVVGGRAQRPSPPTPPPAAPPPAPKAATKAAPATKGKKAKKAAGKAPKAKGRPVAETSSASSIEAVRGAIRILGPDARARAIADKLNITLAAVQDRIRRALIDGSIRRVSPGLFEVVDRMPSISKSA